MLDADWFVREGRVEAVSNMNYLEKLLLAVITERMDEQIPQAYAIEGVGTGDVGKGEELKVLPPRPPRPSRYEAPRSRMAEPEGDSHAAVEVARLENHVELLADKLHQLQTVGTAEALLKKIEVDRKTFEATISSLRTNVQTKEQLMAVMQNNLGQTKEQLSNAEAVIRELSRLKTEHEAEIERLRRLDDQLEDISCGMENRLLMLLEDCYRFSPLIDDVAFLKEKLKAVNTKFSKLEMDVQAGNIGFGGDSAALVQLDDPIFTVIQPAVFIPRPKEASKGRSRVSGTLFTSGVDTSLDTTVVDLQKFRLSKPPFANLIASEIPDAKADFAELPFPLWLEATIRGIYDSKYSEHLLCAEDSGRQRSAFPEFVYAWLGQYTVDEKKREVTNLDWSLKDQADRRRYSLLKAISTEKAKKAWEVWTFREFLMENSDLDQLSFFLHSRQLLLRGPQLHTTSGKYAVIHYLPMDHVTAVVDKLMAKLTITDRSSVKGMILDKARDRSGVLHVDCSYVLRILLAYYEREKKSKFKVLEELFQLAPKTEVKHAQFVDFSAFKQICANINQDLSDLEVVTLYRNTWKLGKGEITPETMFIAANETNFLYKCLRLGNFWPSPHLNTYNDVETGISPLNDCYAAVLADWRAKGRRLEVLKEGVMRMGLLSVATQIGKIEGVLKRKGQLPLEETAGRHLGETYLRLWWCLCQAELVHLEQYGCILHTRSAGNYASSVLGAVDDFKAGCRTFHADLHGMKVARFVMKLAVNRIQRVWKVKKTERRRRRRSEHRIAVTVEPPAT